MIYDKQIKDSKYGRLLENLREKQRLEEKKNKDFERVIKKEKEN